MCFKRVSVGAPSYSKKPSKLIQIELVVMVHVSLKENSKLPYYQVSPQEPNKIIPGFRLKNWNRFIPWLTNMDV